MTLTARDVRQRHVRAATLATTVRELFNRVIKCDELPGLVVSELPPELQGTFDGFDLTFADRHVRLIFTASNREVGNVAIEGYRVNTLTRHPPISLAGAIEIDADDTFEVGAERRRVSAATMLDYFVSAAYQPAV